MPSNEHHKWLKKWLKISVKKALWARVVFITICLLLTSSYLQEQNMNAHNQVHAEHGPIDSKEKLPHSDMTPLLPPSNVEFENMNAQFNDLFIGGGMNHAEQELLSRTYAAASSVFEWGMGSSTLIADHMGIERLTAVDSSPTWVDNVRTMLKHPTYSFRHADIGPVIDWGNPKNDNHKDLWPDYSLQVVHEETPFDVYLVDGRFRVACACQALLHGRADSLVMVHDFGRDAYQVLLILADKIEQERNLSVLRRKTTVSDEEIRKVWEQHKFTKN